MGHEEATGQEVKKDGARWLDMLGYGHLTGELSPFTKDGIVVLWDDFTDICGEHAAPVLAGIERLPADDPRRIQGIKFITERYILPNLPQPKPARQLRLVIGE